MVFSTVAKYTTGEAGEDPERPGPASNTANYLPKMRHRLVGLLMDKYSNSVFL